jgi:molybdopterin-containing oxidoreductase family membrane subunit
MPFGWGTYRPTVTEMGIIIGSFAWFFFWFLLFVRLFPAVAISEIKEVVPAPMRSGRGQEAHG